MGTGLADFTAGLLKHIMWNHKNVSYSHVGLLNADLPKTCIKECRLQICAVPPEHALRHAANGAQALCTFRICSMIKKAIIDCDDICSHA